MSRILLIEPHRVLQQALALSLFPEHDVRVEASIDAAAVGGLKEVDLLIIDTGALRTAGRFSPELQRALQAVNLPILWIDEEEKAPRRDRAALIAPPIAAASLQSAVADLLSGTTRKAKNDSAQSPAGSADAPAEADSQPIELVEVVEESPEKTK